MALFRGARDWPPLVQQTAYALGKLVLLTLPLPWLLFWRGAVALPNGGREGRRRGIWEGLAFGLIVAAAILAGYRFWLEPAGLLMPAGRAIAAKVSHFGIAGPAGFVAMSVFYALVHSLLEEYYWRWFVFGQMRRFLPPAAAIALSSLAFGLHHVIVLAFYFGWRSPATMVFSLGVALGGAIWAWIYHRSGSLLGPWLSHAVVDAAIFAVGYQLVRSVLSW